MLTDPAGFRLAWPAPTSGGPPVVVVDHPRQLMAELAARIYGRPAEAMTMYAITGTTGKTTTSFFLEAALLELGIHTGLIGTIGFRVDQQPLPAPRTTVTTPESTELHGLLATMVASGAEATVMEVSSHALALGRVDAIIFAVAAFTNLGRDHLDFHADEESYFEAKASLFTANRCRHAVVSIDDVRGRQLAARIRGRGLPLTTVSLDARSGADCCAVGFEVDPDGRTQVQATMRGRGLHFDLSLPGNYNVRNGLTALAMIDAAGLDVATAAAGLGAAYVPGRMQRVELAGAAPIVYVDFAHTPQAVEAVLAVLASALPRGRRIVVLGAGGDRDSAKRGPMGAAAARGADTVIITDDNPRTEDPQSIRAAILSGAREAMIEDSLDTTVVMDGNRRSAIAQALRLAGTGDVIAVLGKGHETGQEIGDTVNAFNDAEEITRQWSEQEEQR